jgi:hypothetical protein
MFANWRGRSNFRSTGALFADVESRLVSYRRLRSWPQILSLAARSAVSEMFAAAPDPYLARSARLPLGDTDQSQVFQASPHEPSRNRCDCIGRQFPRVCVSMVATDSSHRLFSVPVRLPNKSFQTS